MGCELLVAVEDITKLNVDVVVNAANERLAGGGGVDGAIHRAAGAAELQQACRRLGGCPTGEVRATEGFRLPAKWIYHTVGPIWQGGGSSESVLLANCYTGCLKLAEEKGMKSIAFPAISCGVYGYPLDAAVEIAVQTSREFVVSAKELQQIIFCCFDEAMADRYRFCLSLGR